jgi:hypothetical protein
MTLGRGSDVLEIVNGPEDGSEFPLVRSPVDLGNAPSCLVQPRMDRSVSGVLARATVVAEGYRIRRMGGGHLLVDGKRVGRIRSRILRNGGLLVLGDTEFVLITAVGGLASRSHGMPQESDAAWALRLLVGRLTLLLRRMGGIVVGLLPSVSGGFIAFVALVCVALLLLPGLRIQTLFFLQSLWTYARYFLSWFGN